MRIDEADRLLDNCKKNFQFREFMAATNDMEKEIFKDNINGCSIACIDVGIHKDFIYYPLPRYVSHIWKENDTIDAIPLSVDVGEWIYDQCQRVELKVALIGHEKGKLFWIRPTTGEAVFNGELLEGEKNTVPITTSIGHQFKVTTSDENTILAEWVVKYNSFVVAGNDSSKKCYRNVTEEVNLTFESEFERHRDVKRTFTELGFDKGRLPNDVWASISAFYYNNRNSKAIESWYKKRGIYVNWWEQDVYMILFPFDLSKYWQARLKVLVEKWVGMDLELTDIYGLREYQDGARLLTHVDRTQTHAVSLIINVAQKNIRVPWAVEIYDHADRLHEITMDEGDIVYYESAKCLHGRMKPLEGEFYVNLFAHYRPVGDPDWFKKENPPDSHSPKPLLDIGECVPGNPPKCSGSSKLPYLSPQLYKLESGEDLFDYWNIVGVDSSLNPLDTDVNATYNDDPIYEFDENDDDDEQDNYENNEENGEEDYEENDQEDYEENDEL